MSPKHYNWIIGLSFLLLVVSAVAGVLALEPWKTAGALLAGAAASLVTTALIQRSSAKEQNELLKELALSADGIQELPDEFRRLKWIAVATTTLADDEIRCVWRVRSIEKQSDSGKNFAVYKCPSKNLVGEDAIYQLTFIGLTGAVVAIFSLGNEPTSVVVFDTPVPAAGLYFGLGYITNWFAQRDVTLAIAGLGNMPVDLQHQGDLREAFRKWFSGVKWDAETLGTQFGR